MNTQRDPEAVSEFTKTKYFHVGRASDLTGFDRMMYRFFEMLPGLLAWITLLGTAILSAIVPTYVAIFIIAFDLYWLLKTIYLTLHHRHNWRRMKHMLSLDWKAMLEPMKFQHLYHMVILPYYTESEEVVAHSLQALVESDYDKNRMIVVLASEMRAGEDAYNLGLEMKARFQKDLPNFIITRHPADLPGEMAGKGSNISYAAETARTEVLDTLHIPYKDVIVSAFDIDTVAYPQYFLCLTWNFLTAEHPYASSFQPVPLYNNNVWQAPALSRVAAMSGTFWQMIQQERPEQTVTFSSHSLSFDTLYRGGYWQKNMVSEDSRIFWNLFMAHDGHYDVIALSYPVSMDANLAGSLWQTSKNIYKQHRRWMWGAENIPYMLMGFIKNPRIPLLKKLNLTRAQLEGFWSLSTNPLMILMLGWLPIIIGGSAFNGTVLSYNLTFITKTLMTIAMTGLIFSAFVAITLLPPAPEEFHKKWWKWIPFWLQWVLVPFTLIIFGAIPGLEAQTRLMLGRYMGFWVTPKHRAYTKSSNASAKKAEKVS